MLNNNAAVQLLNNKLLAEGASPKADPGAAEYS
jgi:hypothetical protein